LPLNILPIAIAAIALSSPNKIFAFFSHAYSFFDLKRLSYQKAVRAKADAIHVAINKVPGNRQPLAITTCLAILLYLSQKNPA